MAAEVQSVTDERRNLPSSPNEMVDAWLKSATETERRWNEFFNQIMGTDAFAQSMARSMESNAAVQAAFARGMEQYLRLLGVPTQADLAKLAERLTALEQRLDAREAAKDEGSGAAGPEQPASRRRSRGGSRTERGSS